jgi:hydroxyacylglutathione hydrolase
MDFTERQRTIPNLQVVDVRNPGEVANGMISDAIAIPVGQLPARVEELDPHRPTVVYCAGGYRSSVAASLLRHRGFSDVSDVRGGYNAWLETLQSA